MWKRKPPVQPEPTPPAPPPLLRLGNAESHWVEPLRPTIRIAMAVIGQAIREQASQIRLTPDGDHTTVQYQVGGQWRDTMSIPHKQVPGLFAAFKALAGLPDWEHRMTLHGLIAVRFDTTDYDVYLSITPTRRGEKITMALEAVAVSTD